MRPRLIAILALVLGGDLTLVAVAGQDRVYSVPQILAGLARDPRAWMGRTALVQGTAMTLVPACPSGQWCASGLYQPHTRRPGPILLLEPGPADPVVARLRHLPLVSYVVPGPQQLHWQTPAVYRIVFQAVPNTTCHELPCITAFLADAIPQGQ